MKEIVSQAIAQMREGKVDLDPDTILCNIELDAQDVRAIAEELQGNTTLTSLRLRQASITAEGAEFIAKALKQNNSLTNLDLFVNPIGKEGARFFSEALKENTSLTSLNVFCNEIGAEGAASLAEMVKVNTTLLDLNVANDFTIGPMGCKALSEALKINTTLTSINFYLDRIGPTGAVTLAEALRVNKSLKTLNLKQNSLGPDEAKSIGEALKENASLTWLCLQENPIGNEGAKFIADALKENVSLTSLGLHETSIGPLGAESIAGALKENTTVVDLDLSNNSFAAKGAKSISEALKINSSITAFNLGHNSLGAEGAEFIAEALTENTALVKLYLSRNSIQDEGARSISERVKGNTALVKLFLGCNGIGEEGARSISDMLKENTSLTCLNLNANSIGRAGAASISEVLKDENTTLAHLHLYANDIEDAPDATDATCVLAGLLSPNLVTLDVGKNELTRIPADVLLRCGKFNPVEVNNSRMKNPFIENPITSPPKEVVDQGLEAVRDFLEKVRKEGGAQKCGVSKMMLVGLGEAGKTSLLNAIRDEAKGTSDKIDQRNRTVGIDVHVWEPSKEALSEALGSGSGVEALQVNACDFAGQSEYGVTHQLFLTPRSFYVLVWDATKVDVVDGETGENAPVSSGGYNDLVDRWLDTIQTRAPGARILLVATHCGKFKGDPGKEKKLDAGCRAMAVHVAKRVFAMRSASLRAATRRISSVRAAEKRLGEARRALDDAESKAKAAANVAKDALLEVEMGGGGNAEKAAEGKAKAKEAAAAKDGADRARVELERAASDAAAEWAELDTAARGAAGEMIGQGDLSADDDTGGKDGKSRPDRSSISLEERMALKRNVLKNGAPHVYSTGAAIASSGIKVDTLDTVDDAVLDEVAAAVIRVDSVDGDGILEARRKILECVASMPEVGLELPPSWIVVKKHIEDLRTGSASSSRLYYDLEEAYTLFRGGPGAEDTQGVDSVEDYAAAARFWHRIGEVYVFQDLLFADPVKVFTLVRTVVRHADDHRKKENQPDPENAGHQDDFALFLDEHILTRRLLVEHLWRASGDLGSKPSDIDVATLIALLESFGVLISRRDEKALSSSSGAATAQQQWFVPSMVAAPEDGRSSGAPHPRVLDDAEGLLVRRFTFPVLPFAFMHRVHSMLKLDDTIDVRLGYTWGLLTSGSKGKEGCEAVYRLDRASAVFPRDQVDAATVGTRDVLDMGDARDVLSVESNDEMLLEAAVRFVRRAISFFAGIRHETWTETPFPSRGDATKKLHLRLDANLESKLRTKEPYALKNRLRQSRFDVSLLRSSAPPVVFISYEWKCIKEVDALQEAIQSRHHLRCWRDKERMFAGDDVIEEMDDGISECSVFLFCLTAKYIRDSPNCMHEYNTAKRLGKPMVLVALEELPLHRELEAEKEVPEWEDWRKERWRRYQKEWTREQRDVLAEMVKLFFVGRRKWIGGVNIDRFTVEKGWAASFVDDIGAAMEKARSRSVERRVGEEELDSPSAIPSLKDATPSGIGGDGEKGGLEEGKGGLEEGKGGLEEGKGGLEEGKGGLEEGKGGLEEGKGGLEEGKGGLEAGHRDSSGYEDLKDEIELLRLDVESSEKRAENSEKRLEIERRRAARAKAALEEENARLKEENAKLRTDKLALAVSSKRQGSSKTCVLQ